MKNDAPKQRPMLPSKGRREIPPIDTISHIKAVIPAEAEILLDCLDDLGEANTPEFLSLVKKEFDGGIRICFFVSTSLITSV